MPKLKEQFLRARKVFLKSFVQEKWSFLQDVKSGQKFFLEKAASQLKKKQCLAYVLQITVYGRPQEIFC